MARIIPQRFSIDPLIATLKKKLPYWNMVRNAVALSVVSSSEAAAFLSEIIGGIGSMI